VTLDPVAAVEGVFSSGGSAGASYYNLTVSSGGGVSIPWDTYPDHAVVHLNCSAVSTDFVGFNLNLASLTGTNGKKIEIILYNAAPNVMYVYRAGGNGIYNVLTNDVVYRSNNLFFITYEVNFTTSNILVRDTSQPEDTYESSNYSIPLVDEVVIEGLNKKGVYTYDGALLSSGAATLTLSWDDVYIQNVFENLSWKIIIYNLPVTVTSVVVAVPSGSSTPLQGILTKTPIDETVSYEWIFSTNTGGWIVT
jgi:hypothetical protein